MLRRRAIDSGVLRKTRRAISNWGKGLPLLPKKSGATLFRGGEPLSQGEREVCGWGGKSRLKVDTRKRYQQDQWGVVRVPVVKIRSPRAEH